MEHSTLDSTRLLSRENAVLVVIDMQEPFLREIFERERVVDNVVRLVRAAEIMNVPVIATLQYADRMGGVIPEISEVLSDNEPIDKRTFSCCRVEPFLSRIEVTGGRQNCVSETCSRNDQTSSQNDQVNDRCQSCVSGTSSRYNHNQTCSRNNQFILCGVESHICVNQTAHDLLARGYQVHIVQDAVSSRTESNWKVGINKMAASGAIISSFETAVYEMLRDSAAPEFKEILKLVK